MDPFTIALIAMSAATLLSGGASIYSATQAKKQAKEAAGIREQQIQLDEMRRKLRLARQARKAKADLLVSRMGMSGSVISSPATAINSSLASQLGLIDYGASLSMQASDLTRWGEIQTANASMIKGGGQILQGAGYGVRAFNSLPATDTTTAESGTITPYSASNYYGAPMQAGVNY